MASSSGDPDPVTTALGSFVMGVLCRDGVDAMRRDADAAVAGLPVNHPFGPAARLLAGIARDLNGGPDEQVLTEVKEIVRDYLYRKLN